MAADKTTTLSIVVRTVDQATAGIKAINARLDATTKPIRDFKSALSGLGKSSGLDEVIGGFKGVGSAVGDLLGKVAMIGGVAGLAVAGLLHVASGYEDLGKKAALLGVGVDFLASMRDAADRSGVPIEALDEGIKTFEVNIGKARQGIGRMAKQLANVTTTKDSAFGANLLRDLKAAKDAGAQIDILAKAYSRLENAEDRNALAQMTLGDAGLGLMLANGPEALKGLRDGYIGIAGPQAEAAAEGIKVGESLKNLKAGTDRLKAALVVGLGPAIEIVAAKMLKWLTGHQTEIAAWVKDIGERLPGAIDSVSDAISDAFDDISAFVKSIGGIKTVAIALGAVLLGPLLMAITTLGVAMLTTPFGLFLVGIAGIIAALTHLKEIKDWALGDHFKGLTDAADKAKAEGRKVTIQELFPTPNFSGEQNGQSQVAATKASTEAAIDGLRKSPLTQQPAQPQLQQETSGEVTVKFENVPPRTRINTSPNTSDNVNVIAGYATGWMP